MTCTCPTTRTYLFDSDVFGESPEEALAALSHRYSLGRTWSRA